MHFELGDIVENRYPIKHVTTSTSYYTSSPSKTAPVTNANWEPEDWMQYKTIIIPPGQLFEIIDIQGNIRYSSMMGIEEDYHVPDYSQVRFMVRLLNPEQVCEDLDKDYFEQPAMVFIPNKSGQVLYGKR